MEIFIFVCICVRRGQEAAVMAALREVIGPSREEPGCLMVGAFQSLSDSLAFHIHSRWTDEVVFEAHLTQPHTARFVERIRPLIDRPMAIVRTRAIV